VDEQERLLKKRIILADATAGILSGFLYLSYVLSFAFLVPVQQSFAGRGMKAGLVSSLAVLFSNNSRDSGEDGAAEVFRFFILSLRLSSSAIVACCPVLDKR